MHDRVLHDLVDKLNTLRKQTVRLRYGMVISTTPLTVRLGNASQDFVSVRRLANYTPAVDDHVAVLVRGNDLLVLGKAV